jgi:hypothetical protein
MVASRPIAVVALAASALGGGTLGCDGCKKGESSLDTAAAPASGAPSSPGVVVKESLPRCRVEGARLAIAGDDLVTGDAAMTSDALLVGVVRREGRKRIASVVRAALDLRSSSVVDVGLSLGDDPPPSPRIRGGTAFVASYARARPTARETDAGGAAGALASDRILDIARLDGATLVSEGSVVQQADESLAYDVAWPAAGKGSPIVAWDEDAPLRIGARLSERGVVKVQLLGAGTKARAVSPEASDAEAPRLIARGDGYWLAWLARKSENADDAGSAIEGAGERRAYRWVELVALDANGEATSPVRKISPEKGHVASFELAAVPGAEGARLVVVVQDEAAQSEGAGERLVRYAIDGESIESAELLDGGIGHALADLLEPSGDAASRWLAFSDAQEHAHVVMLGRELRLAGPPSTEPALDGARIVASAPPDVVYAVGAAGAVDVPGGRIELRRLICR